jgi:hypothetical protein
MNNGCPVKKFIQARCQQLTPVILATREAEIRRIRVRGQPRQTVQETHHKKGLVQVIPEALAHPCLLQHNSQVMEIAKMPHY